MSASASLLGLLLPAAIKATLLLALATVVERTVLRRRASAAARHLLWTFAVLGTLLLPALVWTLPDWRVPLPEAQVPAMLRLERAAPPVTADSRHPFPEGTPPTTASTATGPAAAAHVRSTELAAERALPSGSRLSVPAAAVRIRWTDLLLGVYLVGVLLLLVRVAAEQLVVRRLARGATRVRDGEWNTLLGSLAGVLGLRRPVILLRSDAPTMPLTWGVFRPFILVPAGADAWPSSRRRAVLLHELAHVVRYDCLTQTLAAIACALYWFHPGVWWAAGRLRVERELACDDQALAGGIHPYDYAGHLLAISRALQAPQPLTALAVSMAATSHLEIRMRAAIDRTRARTAPGRRAIALGAVLTATLLLPLAAIRADAAEEAPGVSPPVETPATRVGGLAGDAVSLRETAAALGLAPDAPAMAGTASGGDGRGIVAQASAQAPLGGEWTIRLAGAREASETPGDGPIVHVALRAPGLNTFYVPLARLEGLTAEQVASGEARVRFRLREDAGTFTFEGSFRGGRGTGRFGFAPDPAFAEALVHRGMARPTPEQQFSLARHDVGLVFLDELAAQGYSRPTTEALVRVGLTGVDLQYLRGMGRLGYRAGDLEELVRLSNHSIGPGLIQELASLGYRGLAPTDLLRMRNNGVSPEFVRRMNERAGRQLSVDELVELYRRGGTPGTAAPARAPAASTPLEGRWVVHRARGADADLELFWVDDTNWRRWIASSAFRGVSADDLLSPMSAPVSFRIEQDAGTFEFEGTFRDGRGSGDFRFRPNRQFASALRSLGVEGVSEVTDHQLKNLAYGGVGAAEIREFQALGFAPLALQSAIDLAIFRVTPDYVRAMQSLGVSDANTVPGVIDLRHGGVPTAYVGELAALGYKGLSGSQLIDMRRGRVTPDFIRRVREAGYRNVSPEALIDMRRRGIG